MLEVGLANLVLGGLVWRDTVVQVYSKPRAAEAGVHVGDH